MNHSRFCDNGTLQEVVFPIDKNIKIVKNGVFFHEFAQSKAINAAAFQETINAFLAISSDHICVQLGAKCGMEALSMRVPASSRLRHWYCGKLILTPHAHRKNHIITFWTHSSISQHLEISDVGEIWKPHFLATPGAPRQISWIEIHSTYVGYVWWEVYGSLIRNLGEVNLTWRSWIGLSGGTRGKEEEADVARKSEESHTAMRGMKCAHTKLQTFIHSKKMWVHSYIHSDICNHTYIIHTYVRTYLHTYIQYHTVIHYLHYLHYP